MLLSDLSADNLEEVVRHCDASAFLNLQAACHTFQDLDARLVQRVWREITLAAMDKPWLAQDAATAVDWKRRYKVLMRAGCRLKLPTVSIEELRREYTFHLDGPYVDGPYQPVIASLTGTARAANSDAEADEGHHESVTDAIFLDFKGDASGMVVRPAYAQRHIRRDVQVYMLHVRRASDGRVAHLATFDLRERDEIYHENHSCTVFRSGQAGSGSPDCPWHSIPGTHYSARFPAPPWLGMVEEAGNRVEARDGNARLKVTVWPIESAQEQPEAESESEGEEPRFCCWGEKGCSIELKKHTCDVPYIDHTNFMGAASATFPITLGEFPAVLRALEWA